MTAFGDAHQWRVDDHRTDLISVAMGRDGTIYVGTRGGQQGSKDIAPGWVYALWGFDQ